MYFVELACEFAFSEEHMKAFKNELFMLFEKYLSDNDTNIKVCAIKAITAFLANIEDKDFLKTFSPILPILVKTLIEAVKCDSEAGTATIESIIDLMSLHPKFVKPIFGDLITIFTDIIDAPLSDDVRSISITALATMAKLDDVALRKSDTFNAKSIPVLLKTLMKVQDMDLQEWNNTVDEEAISKKDPQACVQDSLPRFAHTLGTKFLMLKMMPYICQALKSNDWKERYGGLMAIAQVSEGSSKYFTNDLDNILSLIFPCFEVDHPRVVNAALGCLALLLSEYAPTMQIKYHEIIMKYLFKFLQDESYLKIQCTAAAAITNFAQKLDEYEEEHKILARYGKDLLSILMNLFDKAIKINNYPLLGDVLGAISVVAIGLGRGFAEYYNTFMPMLKKLLVSNPGENEQQSKVRCLTIECIGHLVSSISEAPELFMSDLGQVCELLISLQNSSQIAFDDSEQNSILDVFCSIASILKDKFTPLLDQIFPRIAEAMKTDVSVIVKDVPEGENDKVKSKKIIQKIFDTKLFGKAAFAINAAQLTLKIAASRAIYKISQHLQKAYFPYLTKTLELVTPYLTYRESKEVKKYATKTMYNLVVCCQNDQQVAEILNNILPIILKEIDPYFKIKNDVEVSVILKLIQRCTELLKAPLLNLDIVEGILIFLEKSIHLCDARKKEILDAFDALDEVDDDKEAEMQEDYNYVNEICRKVMEISGTLLKLYRDKVENYIVSKIAQSYFKLMNKQGSTPDELCISLCLFADILEYSSPQMFVQCNNEFLKYFVNLAENSQNLDVVQTAIFGLGVIAKRMDRQSFSQLKTGVLNICSNILQNPNAKSEERALLTDNAIGALGKIALFQYQLNDKLSQDTMMQFLQMLPLKNDTEEAQTIHKLLLSQIASQNEFLCQNEMKGLLLDALNAIKAEDSNNPESEILDEQGRDLMRQILA